MHKTSRPQLMITIDQHCITGRGIPNQLMRCRSSAVSVSESNVPRTEVALQFAERAGHKYQAPYCFGDDPLHPYPELCERRRTELQVAFNIPQVYNSVLQNQRRSFLRAIMQYKDISLELCNNV